MDLTPSQRELMQYWGTIENAVSVRASTADLWTAVSAAAEAAGNPLTDVSAADMSVLRGAAARVRNAAEVLASVTQDTALNVTMIAEAPWSRPLAEQNAMPAWQVRFQMTTIEDGNEVTGWYTTLFEGALPDTTELLTAAVEEDGNAIAGSYDVGFGGIGSLQILAV